MIKFNTIYDLYVYSLKYKVRSNNQLIEKYNQEVIKLLPEVEKVKHLIKDYINYDDFLNGLVPSLPSDILANGSTELKYANIIIKDYYSVRSPMNRLAEEIKRIDNNIISKKIYKEIIKKCNNKIIDWLLNTGGTFALPFFGTMYIGHDEKNARIKWGESNRKKQEIIDRGGIPYCKEDHDKCIKAGIPYHGEKWLDNNRPDGLLVIMWAANSFIAQHFPDNIKFKFVATRGNYGFVKKLNDFYKTNIDYSKYIKIRQWN